MASSFALALVVVAAERAALAPAPHVTLAMTVLVTTVVWLSATWLTAPTDPVVLERFYRRARPAGPGWRDVRAACAGLAPDDDMSAAVVGALASTAFVYGVLFGVGHALLGHAAAAAVAALVAFVGGTAAAWSLRRLWR